MHPSPNPPPSALFAAQVERCYRALLATGAEAATEAEPSLGGRFFYLGDLDEAARALVVAANIAGAATLTVSADPAAQRQAVRDGVVDFLVNSLDEALRILKNQLRKQETVAVCLALTAEQVESEMQERGVLPDMLRSQIVSQEVPASSDPVLLVWSVATAPARWLPELDALAQSYLGEDHSTGRWLRLAPRYLGRLAQGVRLVRCDRAMAAHISGAIAQKVQSGGIGAPVEVYSVALSSDSI